MGMLRTINGLLTRLRRQEAKYCYTSCRCVRRPFIVRSWLLEETICYWKKLSCHEVDLFHVFHVELFEDANGAGVVEAAFEGEVVDFLFGEIQA